MSSKIHLPIEAPKVWELPGDAFKAKGQIDTGKQEVATAERQTFVDWFSCGSYPPRIATPTWSTADTAG